ncbi:MULTISPECIES: 2,3-diphosphoglycerate-dependent phosphoglycerate mutase [Mammaliicoccus]|uniref:2,3-bisphosphoglycerate-dependent phosphoglycerate mutase n=1 Tax=Mammaliicoccus lentus TaxID=42858 RepID=A0ABS6GYS7_MAMLE|nr:2,3-diphosphoglycerate-dependent phosphoglycerate mutase [Mammaliicoccus lentus]MBF0841017.1 2,3-diphosphoglycerate-dependent phosphoglycerate mutase [Mammaliicoccus lentus]MBU6114301.1 2,3-diphosphoglycerate-dependent phosphoglycerate mutase [Mammaliicoccus lentus]
MPKLILCRHGQSDWNKKNLFTGWADVGLSEQGFNEAKLSGEKLLKQEIEIDVVYTSLLTRAIETTYLLLKHSHQLWIPVYKTWRLNERHYGGLQGKNKDEAREEFGEEQVHIWRRSYDTKPPEADKALQEEYLNDRRYAMLDRRVMPLSESLKDTLDRVIPFWIDHVSTSLVNGHTTLVSAHGNSLRALIKYLEDIPDDEISELEIKTGAPLIYELDDELKVIDKYYL